MPTTSQPRNYWPDAACARAFWKQHELPAYRQLLNDTAAWLQPRPGERWLDLGCGSGQLTRVLWEQSQGTLSEIVGLDCAPVNAEAYQKLRATLQPPAAECVRFVVSDFSKGLPAWEAGRFEGVVSGLAIQYAESYSQEHGCWTSSAYDRLLAEVWRLLRPGGRFVFSVNVPEPAWGRVALSSLGGRFRLGGFLRYLRYLKRAWRMWKYGGWLKREARKGRFHYLPLPVLLRKLADTGFVDIEHRRSYAGQAYLLRCWKP
jgi:ubiquinone/menaquinone biosynthesis C-methylase UbiE